MIHVILPYVGSRKLAFYLAMEEWLAKRCATGQEFFFMWQTDPTVIYGRNQDIEAEVNLDYCRGHHIDVVRRKSGGGCVYSDSGNLMLSYITGGTNTKSIFALFLDHISMVLHSLGFNAVKTEHNDILVMGRKVSGNAFYALPRSSIVHGTLLYNVDFSEMTSAITPSAEKLQSHGVRSVRQRVVNIRDIASELTLETIRERFVTLLCQGELKLSDADVGEIEEIEKTYYQ